MQEKKGILLLLVTSFIWGTAFVAQRKGMEYIGPFTFNGIRCYIGALFIIPVIAMTVRAARRKTPDAPDALISGASRKALLKGGLLCGLLMFTASTFQQYGMVFTTAGKAGFITAFYIILVPILGLVLGKKVRPLLWLCVAMSITGLFLLTMKGDITSVNKGDVLVLICAFFFSLHILVIDHYSVRTNAVAISAIQLFITGLISTPCMILFEKIDWSLVLDCSFPILYAGVMSCGIAYTLQIVAQKYAEPTVASLILSLESVFAVLAGIVVLGEVITMRELTGCILMFVAIILAQLPEKDQLNKKK